MSDYTREAEMALDMVRLRRELEAMKAERDVLVNRVDFLNQQNSAQQEQNDALAAHVEQIREAFLPGNDGTDGGRLLAIGYVLNQSPTTSLSRRDAEVAHSVLSNAAAKAPPEVNTWLNALAEDYRRQAGDE